MVGTTPPAQRPAEWVGTRRFPGILLVRLMSRCNEKCLFCMVADEIAYSDDVLFGDVAAEIAAQSPDTQIEFFGGEPTIYPRFLELLRLARSRGHYCSIASNLRTFSSTRFTESVAATGADRIYVRTSLYGDDETLHDYYTAMRGSYRQTIKGIENIVAAGILAQVNIVILRQNVDRLAAMVRQVHDWGVPRLKLGNLINLATCRPHGVDLRDVGPRLEEAIALAEELGLTVTVEKTPICVAGGRVDLISTERVIYSSSRVYDDGGACSGCLVRRWCDGLDPDYAAEYGFSGLSRMSTVPDQVVSSGQHESGELELLRTHCVEIPDGPLDEGTLVALHDLARQVEARHGLLAVFPSRFVDRPAQTVRQGAGTALGTRAHGEEEECLL